MLYDMSCFLSVSFATLVQQVSGQCLLLLGGSLGVSVVLQSGRTALLVAAKFGHGDIVHALLEQGANQAAKDHVRPRYPTFPCKFEIFRVLSLTLTPGHVSSVVFRRGAAQGIWRRRVGMRPFRRCCGNLKSRRWEIRAQPQSLTCLAPRNEAIGKSKGNTFTDGFLENRWVR
jgi:hypothetical protein